MISCGTRGGFRACIVLRSRFRHTALLYVQFRFLAMMNVQPNFGSEADQPAEELSNFLEKYDFHPISYWSGVNMW